MTPEKGGLGLRVGCPHSYLLEVDVAALLMTTTKNQRWRTTVSLSRLEDRGPPCDIRLFAYNL